jgi:hypothetical protein
MKLFVIYANCHSYPIEFYLKLNNEFNKTYTCRVVSILNYLNKPDITQLNDIDISNLQKADVVLCQFIQNDRNYLNHKHILSFCKNDAKILMMPHHRFSVYSIISKNEFKFKINDWTFIPIEIYDHYLTHQNYEDFKQNFDEILKSIKITMPDSEISRYTNYYIDLYSKIVNDQSSAELNMIDFVKENYKCIQLFSDDSHPTGIFFMNS